MYRGSQLNNSYSQFDGNRQDSYQTARRNVAPAALQGGTLSNVNQPYDTRVNEPMAGTSYHRNQSYFPENGSSYYNQPRRAYPGGTSRFHTGTESHDIPQQTHSRYWPTQTSESRHQPTVIFPFNPDSSYRTDMPRNKTPTFPGMQESICTPRVVMGSNNPMYQNNPNQDYMPTQRSLRPDINSGVPQFNTGRELSSAFKPYRRISPHRQDDDTCRDIFHTKQYNNNTANTERFLIPIRENKMSNYEKLDKMGLVPNRVRVVSGNEPPRPERLLQTLETAERECRSNQTTYAKKLAHSFDDASRQIIIPAPSQIKVRHRDHHKHHHHGSHYYQQHQVDALNAAASGLCHFDQKSYLVQSMSGNPYQEMVNKSGLRLSHNPVYQQMSEAPQVPVAVHSNIYPQYLASQQMGYDPVNVPRDLYCTMDGGTYFQLTGIQSGENADLLQQACLAADLGQCKEASTCTINTKEENVEVNQIDPHVSNDEDKNIVTEETIAIDVPMNQSIETMTEKEKASMEYLLELLDQGPESDKIFPNKSHSPDIEKGVMESLSDQVMALQGSDIAEHESATPYTFHIDNGIKVKGVDAIESLDKPEQETNKLLGTSANGLYKSTREEKYDIQDDDLIAQLVDLPADEEFTTKQMLTNTVKEDDTTALPLFETVSDYDDFQDALDRAAFGPDVCSYIDFDNEIFKTNNNNEENAISKADKVSLTDTVLVDDLVEISFETGLQTTDVDGVDQKNSTEANLQEQTTSYGGHSVTNKCSQSYLPRENSPNNSIQDLVTELGTNVSSIVGDILGNPEVR